MFADSTRLLMLTSPQSEVSHNIISNVWERGSQEVVEAAGVRGARSRCQLPGPGSQVWESPGHGGRGQESESMGGGETKLYHESIR